jgi:sigma-70-like protein
VRIGFSVRRAKHQAAKSGAAENQGCKADRFKALALPHLDDAYTLARYLLPLAEDAVQECYLRAFRYFDSFSGSAIKPWLLAILRNVCRGGGLGLSRGVEGIYPRTRAAPMGSDAKQISALRSGASASARAGRRGRGSKRLCPPITRR